jgi:chromosome partitioning protein
MALLLAIANQKGGCGKTTTTMNLAGVFTRIGYKVLVVDADPQSSAKVWSMARGQGSLPFDVMQSLDPGIAGRINALTGGFGTAYEIILVDCPPGMEVDHRAAQFARAVIAAADGILVPLLPSSLDFSASASFVRFLGHAKAPATKTAVLLNAVQRTKLGTQAAGVAAQLFAPIAGTVILSSTIGRRALITEVSGSGKTILDYAGPRHPATVEYTNLATEILQWLSNAPISSLQTSAA